LFIAASSLASYEAFCLGLSNHNVPTSSGSQVMILVYEYPDILCQ
jgi:hypothetical protein